MYEIDFRPTGISLYLALRGLVGSGVTDLIEGSFDERFALLTNVVIDGGHRLDRAGGWTGEGELTIDDLALVQRERSVTKDDETAVGELASFVFVEIKHDFFVGKVVFRNFHWYVRLMVLV